MAQKNTSFIKSDDGSYLTIVQKIFGTRWCGYEDAYNYYDIDINNILPYETSDNE